jgi:transcriptional regulator with PAS, ATPase and Fis domain
MPKVILKEPEIDNKFIISNIVSVRKVVDGYISWVLSQSGNNQFEAAQRMQISPKTIYNRIRAGAVKME